MKTFFNCNFALALAFALSSNAQSPVDLGSAAAFSVLGASTVTNTGATTLQGFLGVSPGTAVTGSDEITYAGTIHSNDAVAQTAQNDALTAYNSAAGLAPEATLATELGGTTLSGGVYALDTAQITGQLTLDAQGSSDSVWIFQISSTLVAAVGSSVIFVNGASCNVFWQVGSSATLAGTSFVGDVVASASITVNDAAAVSGGLYALTGAVTLIDDQIGDGQCASVTTSSSTSLTSSTSTPLITTTATTTTTSSTSLSDTSTSTSTPLSTTSTTTTTSSKTSSTLVTSTSSTQKSVSTKSYSTTKSTTSPWVPIYTSSTKKTSHHSFTATCTSIPRTISSHSQTFTLTSKGITTLTCRPTTVTSSYVVLTTSCSSAPTTISTSGETWTITTPGVFTATCYKCATAI